MIQSVYDRILRPHLSEQWMAVEDIIIRRGKVLDKTDTVDDYEKPLRHGINDLVRAGDHVVIVGGGYGASTVAASRATGAAGRVTVFEAVEEMVDRVQMAVDRNYTPADHDIHHCVVERAHDRSVELYGPADGQQIRPQDVPTGDVWVLDAEGRERELLRDGDPPRRIVVETHGFANTDDSTVPDNYEVSRVGREADDAVVWTASAEPAVPMEDTERRTTD